MFRLPIGMPVLAHAQIGIFLKVFYGSALRPEDGYNLGAKYEGKISIVRVSGGGWGQNEQLEIIHGIDHFNHLKSATYWVYADEYKLMINDFSKSWDSKEKLETLSKLLSEIGIQLSTNE